MEKQKINWLAIIVLVVAWQLIAVVWYGALADPWMELNKFSEADFGESSATPYIIAIITALITNYVLAALFKVLNIDSAMAGLRLAILCWIGFTFAEVSTLYMFSLKPFSLTLIDTGKSLITFALSGIVLGAWLKYE